jgi:oxaloacetate decarboxylase alpha subunit
MAKKTKRMPLKITDTTLRDAHQSLWATRMRTRDILDILDVVDSVGYYSLEVWGGATFDVCMRFLRENPWERLRQIKKIATKTPLQMLLRGQNILGYKHYPDDLLERFVALASTNGVDIFRIFDALNDNRNIEQAIKYVNKYGGHAQGTICYTISPVHTVEKYVEIAKEQVQMGIDSLCIKDMAGILSPMVAEKLVKALVAEVDVPIQVHSHATSGMAYSTYVEAARAGAEAIDCAISVMSGFSSQPPVETMASIFEETDYKPNLDRDALRKICKYFTELAPKRELANKPINIIDPEVLLHHIPGGMISNLRSQLDAQGALDRLDEVLEELPKTRADLGYPPLVTPTSQIVGVQSVLNVLSGKRYSMITEETKNYIKGMYGQAPSTIKASLAKKVLGKTKPITYRPADDLEPILPTATKDIDPKLIDAEEDIISYCLFPEQALEYFKWRILPTEERGPIPADLERQAQDVASVVETTEEKTKPFLPQADYKEIESLINKVNKLGLTEFTIRRNDLSLSMKSKGFSLSQQEMADSPIEDDVYEEEAVAEAAPAAPKADAITIDAPLNGTFYTSNGPGKPKFVEEGTAVKSGDTIGIVEAMKMMNDVKAKFNCKVVRVLATHGESVTKGQPLIEVEK